MPFVSGIAYALTAATTVQGGDSGELAAVGSMGGVAHPPGYPLFILWARLWSWLPGPPAHGVALATAITGALAVDAVQRAARGWGASEASAMLAAAMFAVSPLASRLSTEPEVFMLNVAIVMTIVRLATSKAHPAWLALLAGLAIANHHTAILCAPIGIYGFVVGVRRVGARAVLLSAGAFALGLAPYLYLMVAKGDCRWGTPDTLAKLAHHFLRADYGTTQLGTGAAKPEPLAQLGLLGTTFVESGIALTFAIGVARKRWSWPLALLAATVLLAGPLFVLRFNLPPRNLNASIVARFHLLPLALASVFGALGLDAVAARLENRLLRTVALGAAALVLVLRGALSGAFVVAHHRPTTERYLRNVLAMLPPNSVLLAEGDDAVGGLEYMQCALGARPDVVVLAPPLLNADWYAARASKQLGFEIVHGIVPPGGDQPVLDSTDLMTQLVQSKRPLFLTSWFAKNLDVTFPSYPVGPLIHVPSARVAMPSPDELLATNEALFAQMTLDETPPPAHTWAGQRYLDYRRTWVVLEKAFTIGGNSMTADRCHQRVLALTPSSE